MNSPSKSAAASLSPDGPFPDGILQPDNREFFPTEPYAGHYGKSPKARHGQDPPRVKDPGHNHGSPGRVFLRAPVTGRAPGELGAQAPGVTRAPGVSGASRRAVGGRVRVIVVC